MVIEAEEALGVVDSDTNPLIPITSPVSTGPYGGGAVNGIGATEALKLLMAALLGVVVAKPQYGALAAPIGIMFVLFLQSLALYGAASLPAAIAEGDDAGDVEVAATVAEGVPAVATPTAVEET